MAQHLLCYQQSVDQATLGPINAIADTAVSLAGTNGVYVPAAINYIHWAYAVGPNLTRAQLRAPSLGVRRMDLEIVPARRGTEIADTSGPRIFVPRKPIRLDPAEVLQFFSAEDGAGATQQTCFVALGPAELPPMPDGDVRHIRLTGTTTLTARAWTQVTLYPETTIEAGVYVVVGFVPVSAGCVAARLVFEGGGFRPGSLGPAQTAGNPVDIDPARLFNLPIMGYAMGTFRSTALPTAEFYSTTADTSETVIMYVIRIAPLPS